MLVCMLLVVGRSSPCAELATVAARTGVEEERRLGCRAPGVFVLRFGRALLPHDWIIISFLLCIFVSVLCRVLCVRAPLSEYRY